MSSYMMAPGARLSVENGHLVESMGQMWSGPKSGPPGPLAPLTLSGEGCYTGPAIDQNGSHTHKMSHTHGACCSSCASGGSCESASGMGGFDGGVGSLLMLGLAIYGGFALYKKYVK